MLLHVTARTAAPHGTVPMMVPITGAEFLNLCGRLPVVFRRVGTDWEAVALTEEAALREPTLAQNGHWVGGYAPFLVRFRGLLERAKHLPPDTLKAAQSEFQASRQSTQALAEAIALLSKASLLVPVVTGFRFARETRSTGGLFCIDAERLVHLDGPWLAALVEGTPSALEVAIGSLYSMRWADGGFPTGDAAVFEAQLAELVHVVTDRTETPPPGATSWSGGPTGAGKPAQPARQLVDFTVDDSVVLDFSHLT